ncbi:hypothetical protein RJ640_016936 [Escallonia rubra]|uniref:Pentatricopeptide repeat-containing protein n=1 Tax=Escallonia rubra TaxID=112253 RepID=A0AA88RLL1_9ASTE|nr:hypothetical protein RJ640_016936 [Escallonia rubra]
MDNFLELDKNFNVELLKELTDFRKNLIIVFPLEWKLCLLYWTGTCVDIDLPTQVASRLLKLEPEEHGTNVLLSNIYGHIGKWDEIATAKRLMRKRGVKRVPGWIEVKNVVHAFNAEDRSNYHCQKIDDILEGLMEETVVWKMVVQSYNLVN